jgi:hypothetical protein
MNPEIKTLFQEYLKLTEGNKAAAASLVVAHFLAASRKLPVVNQPDGSNVAEKEKGPSTQISTDDQFAELAKASNCLERLQLYTKGKAVNRKMIEAGNYGIPVNDEAVNDLGSQIDIIPLARRPKAIDISDSEAILVSYAPDSEEFKRIAAQSLEKEAQCLYGPSFLVFERSQGAFLEFFCGNKSSRSEAKNIYPYLPLTQADIDAKAAKGEDVTGLVPHGPLPLTLKSRLLKKGTYSWHLPVVAKCNEPFTNLPGTDEIAKEVAAFLAVIGKSMKRATAADDRAR